MTTRDELIAFLAALLDIAAAAKIVLDADKAQCQAFLSASDLGRREAARAAFSEDGWRMFQSDDMRALERALDPVVFDDSAD